MSERTRRSDTVRLVTVTLTYPEIRNPLIMSNSNIQNLKYQIRWRRAATFFAYTLLARLLPYILHQLGMHLDPSIGYYPWNFSPAFAVCLFTGAFCLDKRISILLPIMTFLASDLGIWALTGRADWAFYPSQFAVYSCLLCCTALGFLLREKHTVLRIAATGLAGCMVFFVVTNFAVWALGTTYPHTPGGLLQCYVAAIPYLRNSLLGTAFFGSVLFSPVCVRELATLSGQRTLAEQMR